METSVRSRPLDPRRVLSAAPVYRLFRRIVVRPRRDAVVVEALDLRPGHRVLDLGCGAGDAVRLFPQTVAYVGLDASRSYVEAARRRYGGRAEFHHVEVGADAWPDLGRFDRVLSDGVLHHLDDETASTLLQAAARGLQPGGHLVTIDPCLDVAQRWMSRRLIASDRGRHVRDEAAYRGLATRVFADVRTTRHGDLLRLPYDHLLMVSRAPTGSRVATP